MDLESIRLQTLAVYERQAAGWDTRRPRGLLERPWLDRFIDWLPTHGRVLDAGCGAGEPIAAYLVSRGLELTGVDASESMLDLCRERFPDAQWQRMDLRALNFQQPFHGIVSWDASFHLTQSEQREFLVRCGELLNPGGALLLTIGHEAGEVTGTVEGEAVYHASLSPGEYEERLQALGFEEILFSLEDPNCDFHSIVLARKRAPEEEPGG